MYNFIFPISDFSFKFTMCTFKTKVFYFLKKIFTIHLFIPFKLILICPIRGRQYGLRIAVQ